MGSLQLECPLCCSETFASHDSLKYHLLSIIDNLKCPACDSRFERILELAEHLGRECCDDKENELEAVGLNYEQIIIKQEDSDVEEDDTEDEESIVTTPESQSAEKKNGENVDEISNFEASGSNEELYHCSSCAISFPSVNDHIEEYHQGQEVFLEHGDQETVQKDSTFFVVQPGKDAEEEMEINQNDDEETLSDNQTDVTNLNTLKVEDCVDKSGCLYTRKVVQIDKFWLEKKKSPITLSYILEDGKAKKITADEVNSMGDSETILQIHQCSSCQVHFIKLDQYYKHTCDRQNSTAYKCSKCDACFSSARALSTHMRIHRTEKSALEHIGPYICDICNTEFKTFKSLRLHERMHDPIKSREVDPPVNYGLTGIISEETPATREMFVCNVCNKSYDKQYEEVHMKAHIESVKYDCGICNRKFYTQSNLDMHMRVHINGKKFACSYCKKNFLTYDSLQDHIKNHCKSRPYECQYCGRRFIRPHEKVKHERIHTGEKPHICQICGKAFRVSYCLTLHMRTHSGTRPYQCPHCGKRFKAHSVYNHHLLTHSNVRNYKCPYCPKAFKTAVQLAGHKNSHTKPFTCTECNRPFASLYAVRLHMESHKRENNLKYHCVTCGASYARAFALRDHIKEQHAEEWDKSDVNLTLEHEYLMKDEGLAATNSILSEAGANVLVELEGENMTCVENIEMVEEEVATTE